MTYGERKYWTLLGGARTCYAYHRRTGDREALGLALSLCDEAAMVAGAYSMKARHELRPRFRDMREFAEDCGKVSSVTSDD
jgi:hypothetical protein